MSLGVLQGEEDFWRELQKLYLEPLAEDKEKQKKITNDLKELRNKVCCMHNPYFECAVLGGGGGIPFMIKHCMHL